MQPYGIYPQVRVAPGYSMDCKDVEDSLASGFRIRNKKAKRRHNKKRLRQSFTRQIRVDLRDVA
ncbi:hypothetical protein AB6D11_18710 [Vibrio splendidus]